MRSELWQHASLPKGARRGMVIIHEIFGMQPEIERVVDRFARAGYAAVAPDLFGDKLRAICIAQSIIETARGRGEFIDTIKRARGWLAREAKLDEKSIGIIGFCMGGGFALAAGAGFGAVSTNYGAIPPDELLRHLPPTIGCYGGRDRIFGSFAPILERKLKRVGVPVEGHTFPEVGHSFLTDGEHPIASAFSAPIFHVEYRPEVAERAWKLIFEFFEKNLMMACGA